MFNCGSATCLIHARRFFKNELASHLNQLLYDCVWLLQLNQSLFCLQNDVIFCNLTSYLIEFNFTAKTMNKIVAFQKFIVFNCISPLNTSVDVNFEDLSI